MHNESEVIQGRLFTLCLLGRLRTLEQRTTLVEKQMNTLIFSHMQNQLHGRKTQQTCQINFLDEVFENEL